MNPVINDEQDNLQAADDYRSVLSVTTLKFRVFNAKTHVDVKIRSNEVLFETTSIRVDAGHRLIKRQRSTSLFDEYLSNLCSNTIPTIFWETSANSSMLKVLAVTKKLS